MTALHNSCLRASTIRRRVDQIVVFEKVNPQHVEKTSRNLETGKNAEQKHVRCCKLRKCRPMICFELYPTRASKWQYAVAFVVGRGYMRTHASLSFYMQHVTKTIFTQRLQLLHIKRIMGAWKRVFLHYGVTERLEQEQSDLDQANRIKLWVSQFRTVSWIKQRKWKSENVSTLSNEG